MRRVLAGAKYLLLLIQWFIIAIIAIAGVDYDRPPWREDRMMDIEVIGLERISAKDRGDGDSLAIGKMECGPWRCHDVLSTAIARPRGESTLKRIFESLIDSIYT